MDVSLIPVSMSDETFEKTFRELWRWVSENPKLYNDPRETWKLKRGFPLFKEMGKYELRGIFSFQVEEMLKSSCPACSLATYKTAWDTILTNCDYCPVFKERTCTLEGALYYKWGRAKTLEEQSAIALQISKLPWEKVIRETPEKKEVPEYYD